MRVPEWQGWAVLVVLFGAFGALGWWLLLSRVASAEAKAGEDAKRAWGPGPQALAGDPRARRVISGLTLLGGASFGAGARWDELWHRRFGGFGDDFLWPPHLMLYASLGLVGVFAGFGLAFALRGSGGLRERFRAEPLMGLLGLLAAYQMASIPSDLLWHQIIGPDISAWSLPHLLLALTSSGTMMAGLALAVAGSGIRAWRPLWRGPRSGELVALGLVMVSLLNLLQLGTTEWEWSGVPGYVFGRPQWTYPLVALALGVLHAHLALHATRRVGAATAVALAALLVQLATVSIARAYLPPGPVIGAHLLIVPAALALDAWYAWRAREGAETLFSDAALFALVYLAVAVPLVGRLVPTVRLGAGDRVELALLGLAAALVLGPAGASIGAWLRRLAASEPAPAPSTSLVAEPAAA